MDTLGLRVAIQHHLEDLRLEQGWEVEFIDESDDLCLSSEQEEQLFYIIYEALTNACKHANTTKVAVVFRQETAPDAILWVTIRDWGDGFEPAKVSPSSQHLGLLTMQERVKMLEGVCVIDSQLGQGTKVSVRLAL